MAVGRNRSTISIITQKVNRLNSLIKKTDFHIKLKR